MLQANHSNGLHRSDVFTLTVFNIAFDFIFSQSRRRMEELSDPHHLLTRLFSWLMKANVTKSECCGGFVMMETCNTTNQGNAWHFCTLVGNFPGHYLHRSNSSIKRQNGCNFEKVLMKAFAMELKEPSNVGITKNVLSLKKRKKKPSFFAMGGE